MSAISQRYEAESERDPYSLVKQKKSTRVEKIMRKIGSKKEMMILHEVFKKPKALRDDEYDS